MLNARLKIIILAMALVAATPDADAQKNKRTVKSVQREQTATKKKIAETTRKIDENTSHTQKTLNQLNLLRGEINSKERQISNLRAQIDSLDSSIAQSGDSLKMLDMRLEKLKSTYARALRKMQGSHFAVNDLGFIFSTPTFAKAYARLRYVREFAKWRKRKAEEIRLTAIEIEGQKNHLAQLHSQRSSALTTLNTDQALLKVRQDETSKVMTKLQADGKSLKLVLEKEKNRLKSIDNEITRMIEAERQERERASKSTKGKGNTARKETPKQGGKAPEKPSGHPGAAPAQPKSRIDNSDPDAAMTGRFASAQGRMTFPVATPYRIVGKYGSQAGQPYSTGIEIVLDGNPSARSIFDGTVSRIFQNHDGNFTVMVRHGAYISVYYNIGRPSVRAKENVRAGQAIGTVANDGRYNRPMLHFEVRKGSQTLNPMSWVR